MLKPCSICGTPTEYGCADCAIDRKGFVPLCGRIECREEHERKNPEEAQWRYPAKPLAALRGEETSK